MFLEFGSYENFRDYLSLLFERTVNLEKFRITAINLEGNVLFKIPIKCRILKIVECGIDETSFSKVKI